MRTVGELAAFVTSKNAGPFLLTLDIVFPDADLDAATLNLAASSTRATP